VTQKGKTRDPNALRAR